ncbi:hypothetical protein L917_13566 [Phytophthora nicotianae]|uniref:Tyr recombinase domain-containing protein n=1 Tax=Phytophthora nicotianae TaxID=4792 RepID=W2KS50_PHYNI|nr:hypothetical protein L917_13566 [Phytophthora nicotianae]
MFAFIFDGYVVIDLSCGFGWCGSPAFYSLAGAVINDLYESRGPTTSSVDSSNFVGNVWCDDQMCVEILARSRCHDANIAFRRAMAAVLGPSAINDEKFTEWSQINKALGLVWNTSEGTVSIPLCKLQKAERRVYKLLEDGRSTKRDLNSVLGAMRHVSTCFPPARAFYQRLHVGSISMAPFASKTLSGADIDDLVRFGAVLARNDRFNGIPVAQFANIADPDIHVYMDACDDGLCALDPSRREFIRLQFSPDESRASSNSINIRELQIVVLAALVWGPNWRQEDSKAPVHVRLHIDNISAVAWSTRRLSRHPMAQLYNRLLSLTELQYNLHRQTLRRSHRRVESVLLHNSLANTTKSKYSATWRQWCRFSRKMRWSPWIQDDPKSSSRKLRYFTVYLWRFGGNISRKGNQYSTIRSKLSNVLWYQRRFGDTDVAISPRLNMLLKDIKRTSDPVVKKQPVTPAFLRLLYRSLNRSQPRHRLLWGSVLIAYFFLLRRSEYLVVNNKRSFYCLKTKNAFFADAQGSPVPSSRASAVPIGLSGARNDQFGRGAWRTMHPSGDRILCPLMALRNLLKARRELKMAACEYLCLDLDHALKRIAKNVGVPAANYATHSLRSGGATALLQDNVGSLAIKLLGRWKSRCYEDYPRQSASSTAQLAHRMV